MLGMMVVKIREDDTQYTMTTHKNRLITRPTSVFRMSLFLCHRSAEARMRWSENRGKVREVMSL